MARMVFQEEVHPGTIKAMACAICLFSGKLMFVLYFLLYTLSWREKRECCQVQICQLFFFFFFFVAAIPVLLVLLFSFSRSDGDYPLFFSPLLLFLSQFCFGIMVVTYFFTFFLTFPSLLFASFHSIKKKGLVRFPWNGGSVCMACESKLR